jgi:hypothetical protein
MTYLASVPFHKYAIPSITLPLFEISSIHYSLQACKYCLLFEEGGEGG